VYILPVKKSLLTNSQSFDTTTNLVDYIGNKKKTSSSSRSSDNGHIFISGLLCSQKSVKLAI